MKSIYFLSLVFLFVIVQPHNSFAQSHEIGAFVIKLGQDTVGVDKYTRVGHRVFGEGLVLGAITTKRYFDIQLNADGAIEKHEEIRFDLTEEKEWKIVSHQVVSCQQEISTTDTYSTTQDASLPTVTDSSLREGCSSYFFRNIPFFPLFHLLATWIRTETNKVAERTAPWWNDPQPFIIEEVSDELVTFENSTVMGKFRAHLDDKGRMDSFEGNDTGGMQYQAYRVTTSKADSLIGALVLSPSESKIPHSPRAQVKSREEDPAVIVFYGRPSKRGRNVYGGVVPFDKVWRTGANRATHIDIFKDLSMEGYSIPAGEYTMYTIPSASQWTLIINKQTGQWGTKNYYDESLDLARIPMKTRSLPQVVEQFTISVEENSSSGILKLMWDTTEASVTFEVK